MAEITDGQPGGQTPRSNTGIGLFLIKALVLFVVIAGGVAVGYIVASRFGHNDRAPQYAIDDPDRFNKTSLKTGDDFPDLAAWIDSDDSLVLPAGQLGRKTILAFISVGCEPCDYVIDFLDSVETINSSSYDIILLATEFEDPSLGSAFDLYHVDPDRVTEFGIQAFPAVIGLDENGTISFVSSGFSKTVLSSLIEKYL
jgi:hypothetical protein